MTRLGSRTRMRLTFSKDTGFGSETIHLELATRLGWRGAWNRGEMKRNNTDVCHALCYGFRVSAWHPKHVVMHADGQTCCQDLDTTLTGWITSVQAYDARIAAVSSSLV